MASGVEFEEDKLGFANKAKLYNVPGSTFSNPNAGQPAMVRWLMNKGIVKTPNVGQIVLIGVIIFNIIITYIIVKFLI